MEREMLERIGLLKQRTAQRRDRIAEQLRDHFAAIERLKEEDANLNGADLRAAAMESPNAKFMLSAANATCPDCYIANDEQNKLRPVPYGEGDDPHLDFFRCGKCGLELRVEP